MRNIWVVLLVAFIAVACAMGCKTTKSTATYTGPDGTANTVESVAVDLNTEQISTIVAMTGDVWKIIHEATSDARSGSADPGLSEWVGLATQVISSLKSAKTYNETDVKSLAVQIAVMAYVEAGKIPTAGEVSVFAAEGRLPTDAELVLYRDSGHLRRL